MSNQPLVQYASLTDVGMRRSVNQDSLAVRLCSEYSEWAECGHLFGVADGMGGHSVGDLASRISVETLPLAYFKADADSVPERLKGAIVAANQAINDKARENPEFADMGTTCSALTLSPFGAFVGHVGDSRVYRVRNGEIEQLTFDHSLQWEMIRQGRATMDNVDMLHPRNVITRCLGPDQNVNIDIEGPFHVQNGDRFVICSDGLTGHVTDAEIGAVIASLPAAKAAKLLINLANCRGGADNITVVVANIENYPPIAGHFVDINAKKTGSRAASSGRKPSLASRISLSLFLFLATFGLVLLALGKVTIGMLLICPALILGFIRFIIVTSKESSTEDSSSDASGMNLPPDNHPAPASPYRSESAQITPQFLGFLAEAQSELTQAATENGWNVNVDKLTELNRKAVNAAEKQKFVECLRCRAEAIDALMKELYAKTRRNQP